MNNECVFCKIIKGEIPSSKIYEDNDVIAILDISQVTYGHTLVIPKEHYPNMLATPKELMHKVMDVAQRVGQIQMEVLGAEGVNVLTNVNEIAGQTVMHFHVHVIPRYNTTENGFRISFNPNPKALELLPDLAAKLKIK